MVVEAVVLGQSLRLGQQAQQQLVQLVQEAGSTQLPVQSEAGM